MDNVPCYVCGSDNCSQDLEVVLQSARTRLSGDSTTNLIELEDRLKEAENIVQASQIFETAWMESQERADEAKYRVASEDLSALPSNFNTCDISGLIENLSKLVLSIQQQIDDQETSLMSLQKSLSNLQEEGRFHQIQDSLVSCRRSQRRIEDVQKQYNSLVLFGESVHNIYNSVDICLGKRLINELPSVEQSLSQAFVDLAQHPLV